MFKKEVVLSQFIKFDYSDLSIKSLATQLEVLLEFKQKRVYRYFLDKDYHPMLKGRGSYSDNIITYYESGTEIRTPLIETECSHHTLSISDVIISFISTIIDDRGDLDLMFSSTKRHLGLRPLKTPVVGVGIKGNLDKHTIWISVSDIPNTDRLELHIMHRSPRVKINDVEFILTIKQFIGLMFLE